jgi:hypothetical protein
MADPAKIARALSPAQRHCILRFSEAEEWGGSRRGMGRIWPDLVAGRKMVGFTTIRTLINLGLAYEQDGVPQDLYGLTSLGLTVQLHVRCMALPDDRGRTDGGG